MGGGGGGKGGVGGPASSPTFLAPSGIRLASTPGAARGVAALAEGMPGGVASQLVGMHAGRQLLP
ncbi:MAG: hypothetical protein FRX49_12534 [Trebouxia sp. A1-2]|nr:MAG: hypothetical protein FRX49_12534 [Trebouxia sp. A1-2]